MLDGQLTNWPTRMLMNVALKYLSFITYTALLTKLHGEFIPVHWQLLTGQMRPSPGYESDLLLD